MGIFKKIGTEFWRYWKWLCIALVTTTVILFLLAAMLTNFNPFGPKDDAANICIEGGGTWNADTSACHRAG